MQRSPLCIERLGSDFLRYQYDLFNKYDFYVILKICHATILNIMKYFKIILLGFLLNIELDCHILKVVIKRGIIFRYFSL